MREGTAAYAVPGIATPCHTWYKIIGDIEASTAPLLIIHGGPGASHEYLLPLTDLAPTTALIFYDQIGNGRSTHLPDKAGDEEFWTVELFVKEIDNLLAHLGLEGRKIDVYGQSWGGMLAAEWAATSPSAQNLRYLILSNSLASIESWRNGLIKNVALLPEEHQKAFSKASETKDFENPAYLAAVELFYKRHLSLSRPWPPKEVSVALDCFEKNPCVYNTMYGPSELTITGSLRNWTSIPLLNRIKVPTLLLHASEDEAQDRPMRLFLENIENTKWVEIENAAHMAHVDQREIYMEHLRDFLRS